MFCKTNASIKFANILLRVLYYSKQYINKKESP